MIIWWYLNISCQKREGSVPVLHTKCFLSLWTWTGQGQLCNTVLNGDVLVWVEILHTNIIPMGGNHFQGSRQCHMWPSSLNAAFWQNLKLHRTDPLIVSYTYVCLLHSPVYFILKIKVFKILNHKVSSNEIIFSGWLATGILILDKPYSWVNNRFWEMININ